MNKYSIQQTGDYSRELAKTLSERFFQNKTTVNGQELMSFSPVKQINLLVIKELLGSWHREMASLKSPYFDFEAEPVKTSLAEFMNVLSQHILIKKPDFEPLLERAVKNTLLLATDMAAFFEQVFLQDDREADLEKMRSYLRYLAYGRELFTNFIDDLNLGNINRDFVLQRFKLYQNAHYKEQGETEKLLDQLNSILPLPAAAAPSAASKPAPPAIPDVFAGEPEPAPKAAAPVLPPVTAQTAAQAPVPPKPQPVAPVAPPVAPPAPVPVAEQPKAPSGGGLNDRFKVEHTSLNDKLRKPAVTTLADSMGGRKIESLRNSISINQRFAFINELFGGDNQAYHAAITQIDQQPDLATARDFVLTDLSNAYGWNNHGEHVSKLMRLLERKFA